MEQKINREQHDAITHFKGPFMCLAGPGAGKTFVITNRVRYLIEECKVDPETILVVTFSRAAALEMQTRFQSMTAGKKYRVRFGTFHSVFFQILKAAYHYEAKDIATSALKCRFLEEALAETDFEVEDRKEFLEDMEREISWVKGDGMDVDCYYSSTCPEQVFRDIYRGYQNRLQSHRMLDFDDMVGYTYELLTARADILARWQKQFGYILVDEFQDINRLQYENVRLLAKPEDNLFIVGDDDQSIYGFRGARPDIMLAFPRHYPGAGKTVLGINYRCSSQILTVAGRLICHNRKRYKKKLTAQRGQGEKIHICRCQDLSSEAEKIVSQIQGYMKQGIPGREIAVLFRTNMQMRTLAGKLMEHGVPFSMKENLPNMFETWMARDILCYVELALGNRSRDKFLKICNRPLRYLSRAAFENPETSFSDLRAYYRQKQQFWMLERIDDFQRELKTLSSLSAYSAIHYIRQGVGYDDFLRQYAMERNVNPDDWLEVLSEIQETARDFATLPEWLAYVESYGEMLQQMKRERAAGNGADKGEDGKDVLSLMTMHGAKGLEFDVVFVPTVNEGVCPDRKALLANNIEEERRLLYVAMTRARTYLHLSFVKERFNKEAEPSRFLPELSQERGRRVQWQ